MKLSRVLCFFFFVLASFFFAGCGGEKDLIAAWVDEQAQVWHFNADHTLNFDAQPKALLSRLKFTLPANLQQRLNAAGDEDVRITWKFKGGNPNELDISVAFSGQPYAKLNCIQEFNSESTMRIAAFGWDADRPKSFEDPNVIIVNFKRR